METRYEKRPISAFWYLLGGAAVGTVVGVLLAPKAGRETREDIQEWRRNARERARSLLEKIPARMRPGKGGVSETFAEVKEKASRQFGS